jgi:hypothetical protein
MKPLDRFQMISDAVAVAAMVLWVVLWAAVAR